MLMFIMGTIRNNIRRFLLTMTGIGRIFIV